MAFGCLTLSLGLSGGVVWQAGKSTIGPYVVELETGGTVRTRGGRGNSDQWLRWIDL